MSFESSDTSNIELGNISNDSLTIDIDISKDGKIPSLSWYNLGYSVKTGRKGKTKKILSDANGIYHLLGSLPF